MVGKGLRGGGNGKLVLNGHRVSVWEDVVEVVVVVMVLHNNVNVLERHGLYT